MNASFSLPPESLQALETIPLSLSPQETASLLRRESARITGLIREQAAGPWRPGRGRDLAAAFSFLKERIIRRVLSAVTWDEREIAIVALGGLSRGELAPGSDLDILILHAPGAPVEEFVRGFLYILWDAGCEVTASTRTVADSLAHAAADATFLTALLQARRLDGSSRLFASLRKRLSQRVPRLGKPLIDEWLREEREAANARAPIFLRQPHLKKRPGGVRLIQTLEWCALITGGGSEPACFPGGLTPAEKRRLETARDYLLFLRILLHFHWGTREDVLALESQQALAAAMRLGGGGIDAVRSLMRYYYRQVQAVHRLLYRALEQAWLRRRPFIRRRAERGERSPAPIIQGVLYVSPRRLPSLPGAVSVLERLAGEPLLFSASVIRYLESCAPVLSPPGEEQFLHESLIRLLGAPYAAQSLRALHFSGLLFRLLPVLLPVRFLYMYNPVHLWPVDVHTIAAIAVLESVCSGALPGPLPDFMNILPATAVLYRDKVWALKLALLLHDAGKGFPGDHAKNGVEVAARFLPGAGVTPQYRAAIIFLIEHHLLLSTVVRRRDTSDRRVVEDLAGVFIRSPYPEEYLDLLFILTFADVWATNPKNLTGYFALTFTRVYQSVRETVLSQPRTGERSAGMEERFTRELLAESGFTGFCREMGDRYLERHDDRTIVNDYRTLSLLAPGKFHLDLSVSPEVVRVTIFAWDRPGLFALLAGVLALNGAAIVRADIHTRQGRALDEFAVTHIFESDSGSVSEADDGERWRAGLLKDLYTYQHDLDRLSASLAALKRKTRVLGAHFSYPPRVTVLSRRPDGALLEISGHDRPALLFDLAWAMARSDVAIMSAFIDTTGWLVHDVFNVRFSRPESVDEAGFIDRLEQVLLDVTARR